MSTSTGASSKVLYSVAFGLGVTLASGLSYWYYLQWKKRNCIPEKWRRVGVIEQINIFPIKSCAPLQLQSNTEVQCEQLGLRVSGCHDRALIVLDDKNQMVTARVYPQMVLIATALLGQNTLAITAPGMDTIELDLSTLKTEGPEIATSVWGTKVNVRGCGAQYDIWFSYFILSKESGLRLAYYPLDKPVKAINPRLLKEPYITKDDRGTFNDATSYMLMNLSSIKELNTRLPQPVNPLQFRGSFHLKMDKDEPYAEDNWKWVKIGDEVIFRVVSPCTRCIFPNINVSTAERDPAGNPLNTLKKYRMFNGYASPALGIHLGLRNAGTIKKRYVVYIEDE